MMAGSWNKVKITALDIVLQICYTLTSPEVRLSPGEKPHNRELCTVNHLHTLTNRELNALLAKINSEIARRDRACFARTPVNATRISNVADLHAYFAGVTR